MKVKSVARGIAKRLVPASVRLKLRQRRHLRHLLRRLRPYLAPVPTEPHTLPGELIVSLTSYPARFGALHLTLASLLNQTVRADRVIMWIAHDDMRRLPAKVRALSPRVEIRAVPDVRSYKKLVFALSAFPGAYIVTADDDIFYKPDWLEELVAGHREDDVIACHRAHRVVSSPPDALSPYGEWDWDVQDSLARVPSTDIMPAGIGGILYPPGSLHPDVTDQSLFLDLSPTADDLWFFWMGRRMGSRYVKVGGAFPMLPWPGGQDVSLYQENVERSGNDRQVAALLRRYGNPLNFA